MDLILLIVAGLFMILGVLGSFLPMLPGVPLSWIGLLIFYLIPNVGMNHWFLGITLVVAILFYILNLIIPAMGTKKFGGSRKGMIGATIGLIVGIFVPLLKLEFLSEAIPAENFMGSTWFPEVFIMEFIVTFAFLILFLYQFWSYKDIIF